MNKFNINATVFLLAFLLSFFAFSSVNSSITCSPSGVSLRCDIRTADETLIHNAIASSFVAGSTKLRINVYSEGAGITLNISLPEYITVLEIDNEAEAEIFVETYTIHSGLNSIDSYSDQITIKQVNFFAYFPNLRYFYAYELGSVFFPIFTQNKQLTSIIVEYAYVEDVQSRVFNHTIFGGLDKLVELEWSDGGITGIKAGSFKGLSELTDLVLNDNSIQELESCTFEGLEKLDSLSIYDNKISIVHPNAFLGLNSLTYLSLYKNPSVPLPAIKVLKSLLGLDVGKVDSIHILPEIIQQLNKLTRISLRYTQFNCTCDTAWISKLSSFGITVYTSGSTCVGETRTVDDSSLYNSCGARSYQCFNKSIECVGESWNRVDTVDGCECVYPEESYSVSEICEDINECEDSAICQGNCTNTPGSYKCSCLDGYYNANDTLCSDINECLLSNGNCTHNCSNTIGSYECSCFQGYVMNASSECFLPNPCHTNNGGCHHNCTHTIYGHACSCIEGFKVSPSNFSHCDTDLNVATGELTASTKALYVLLFICLLFIVTIILMFLFLLLIFFYLRSQMLKLKYTRTPKPLSLAQMDRLSIQSGERDLTFHNHPLGETSI